MGYWRRSLRNRCRPCRGIVADGRLGLWAIGVIVVLTVAVFLPRGIGWKREREKLQSRAQSPDTRS